MNGLFAQNILRQMSEKETVSQTSPSEADGPAMVEGSSFSWMMKAVATVAMLLLGAAGVQMLTSGAWSEWSSSTWLVTAMAVLVIGVSYFGILTSRTAIDEQCIRQSGLWSKEVRLADITQVKLIAPRGFGWLIAPRLVVRAGGLMMITFHAADPRVLAVFRKLTYG
ncbi:MAG: hypothetical protein WCI59_01285 [Betaproteobacteria bacterium]